MRHKSRCQPFKFLFNAGLEYRNIGCHRLAISAYHEYVDRKPVG